MGLKMFDSLLPYFGGKRKLCPVIFGNIDKYLPRETWGQKTFVDAFLGSGAVSMYAKAQGFRIVANDIAERSYIAGKALVENNTRRITPTDIHRLFPKNDKNTNFIEKTFVPDVFMLKHAVFMDNAFANAKTELDKYLIMKYLFHLRPYSKFSSPNAFNRPLSEGRFEDIKRTYNRAIQENMQSPLVIMKQVARRINFGIFSNGLKNEIHKGDVFDFIGNVQGDVLYLDPPYAGTLAYEKEYEILDTILGDRQEQKSKFSDDDGMKLVDEVLSRAEHFPLWAMSFGNAGGKNEFEEMVAMVSKYRKCEAREFSYRHCIGMASEEHKAQSKEWLLIGIKE